jgi:23S rRNA pseudouridine1911/1915/1917 synthase
MSLQKTIDIDIIYEDDDITICRKPVGVLSEDVQGGEKGLIGLLSDRAGKQMYLLHRLDRNVGGVMVFANNKRSASILSEDIRENRLKKEYIAVTDGIPVEEKGEYKDLLFKDSHKNRSYVVKRMRKGVKDASLEYEVMNKTTDKSMVRVLLHTGRTHQIRVQFSSRKTPLTGDIKYGSKDRTNGDIALHSYRISFCHPVTREDMVFSCEPDYSVYPWNLFGGETHA